MTSVSEVAAYTVSAWALEAAARETAIADVMPRICLGMRRHVTTLVLGAALLGGGCGEQPRERVATVPASERQAADKSSIVGRGDYAPDARGPFRVQGRYDVSFVQPAAGVDFHAEVPFTPHLEQPARNGPGRRVKLFQVA